MSDTGAALTSSEEHLLPVVSGSPAGKRVGGLNCGDSIVCVMTVSHALHESITVSK